jgi:hypothetical protein
MRWKAFRRPQPDAMRCDAMRCDAGVGGLWALDGTLGAQRVGRVSERATGGIEALSLSIEGFDALLPLLMSFAAREFRERVTRGGRGRKNEESAAREWAER